MELGAGSNKLFKITRGTYTQDTIGQKLPLETQKKTRECQFFSGYRTVDIFCCPKSWSRRDVVDDDDDDVDHRSITETRAQRTSWCVSEFRSRAIFITMVKRGPRGVVKISGRAKNSSF